MNLKILFLVVMALLMLPSCVTRDIVEDSEIYRLSVERIKADSVVIEAVGSPFTCGMPEHIFVYTNTRSFGQADFKIPVTGNRGSGNVHVVATRKGDTWEFLIFTFSLDEK